MWKRYSHVGFEDHSEDHTEEKREQWREKEREGRRERGARGGKSRGEARRLDEAVLAGTEPRHGSEKCI